MFLSFESAWCKGPKASILRHKTYFGFDFKPFLHHLFSWDLLISESISSVLLLYTGLKFRPLFFELLEMWRAANKQTDSSIYLRGTKMKKYKLH
jgi:hypothetical protein